MTATESANIDSTNPTAAPEAPPANVQLYLEDLVVTALLRQGKSLKTPEITAAAEGLSLPRASLGEGIHESTRLTHEERSWNLAIRSARAHLSREERDRQPLETTLNELLRHIGKPLPLPVIARELTFLRGAFQHNFKDLAAGALRGARWAAEVSPDTFIHEDFLLDSHAPSEALIVRANRLDENSDFAQLRELPLPASTGVLTDDAIAILRLVKRPLPLKLLGFLLWKQGNHDAPHALARALSDRAKFYWFVGGHIALQEYLPEMRSQIQAWVQEHSGGATTSVDVVALLRQRNVKHTAPPRELKPDIIADLKSLARRSSGQATSLSTVMTDVLEMEPEDAQFIPTLHALNDKLRSDPDFMPVGIGQFILRESVPSYVGETPEELRPIQLSVRDPETDEPLDFEMSDDGLEGDAADFVHAPQWDDIGEEAEVKLLRKPAGAESTPGVRYVILNHHHRAGTMKLRRIDEEFFGISGALTRIPLRTEDGQVEAWASRESGLIYGLGEWFKPRTPPSGGVLSFAREGNTATLKIDAPDKLTHLEGHRAEELENLREAANYMSLFELLQTIMSEHGGGMELPTLWAEVNIVRRTSKRLLCSVLSSYHCYYFKQRGPKQILWRFDAGKLDQGFKRNKRKYVRR